jgi:hypothetical protein
MGGKGSGGIRIGAGRPPKDKAAKWLGGNAGKRGGEKKKPTPEPVELILAPADLLEDQAETWNALAPHACAARTLTSSTIAAFRDLCEAICLKRSLYDQIVRDGFVVGRSVRNEDGDVVATDTKAHPLLAHHRGLMQRVEAGMMRFRLLPMGKPLTEAPKPADPWAELDEPSEAVN